MERSTALARIIQASEGPDAAIDPETVRVFKKLDDSRHPSHPSQSRVTAEQFSGDLAKLFYLLVDNTGSLNRHIPEAVELGHWASYAVQTERALTNADAVRIGHNAARAALLKSAYPSPDQILVCTRLFDGTEVNPIRPLRESVELNATNYDSHYPHTPLVRMTLGATQEIMDKLLEFRENFKDLVSVLCVITDGGDNASAPITASDCAVGVRKLISLQGNIVVGMGVGEEHRFRPMFKSMGIDDRWILETGSNEQQIMEKFGLVAKLASAAASVRNFDQVLKLTDGGFKGLATR